MPKVHVYVVNGGCLRITLKDVAERAGVSRSAVSRTFTEGASVAAQTRKKVLKAAEELNYSPSLIARSLATNRTKLIGLVANNFQNPAFLEVFDIFTRELQRRGYRPLLVNLSDETDPAKSVVLLKQYNVDAVIIATSTLPASFPSAFRNSGIPVVHSFGKQNPFEPLHVVGIDNLGGGRMAAEALYARGHRNVAVLGGPESATSTKDRVSGFMDQCAARAMRVTRVHYAENYTYNAGMQAMNAMLSNRDFDAMFCGDDLICMGAMDAVRKTGLSIPDDIGFIGFNDINMAGWSAYDLTTIHQPVREIIVSSTELAIAAADDPGRLPETRLLPCRLVERSTLKPVQ